MYNVTAKGFQIQSLPKNQIEINVELFIKNKLILDENSKIEISKIIYLYKQIFKFDKKLSIKQNKEFNRQIQNEFRKFFKPQKNYYIACKLKDEVEL
jgi:hypothetical protein